MNHKTNYKLKIGSRDLRVIILRLKIEICSYLEKPRVGAEDLRKTLGDTHKALRTDGQRRSGDTQPAGSRGHCSKNPLWRTANWQR